ncbi:MAG: glycosyltransferase [Caldilineaceae bacterium]|nr:glycosyltransferase [Caldilineaceae bacterium]
MHSPTVSIVIPTHNRRQLLRQLLDGLGAQSYPLAQIEVLVVADNCTDGTATMVQSYAAPFSLRLIQHAERCAAVTRNLGATRATGDLLLFLDDDIEPTPELVQAHVRRYKRGSRRVVIGYLPPMVTKLDFFQSELRLWWISTFWPMSTPGHRFVYTDLLSGNFSLERDFFQEVGGFDDSLLCREDYELGMRLIQAGAEFRFAPDALGYHHEKTDLRRALRRKYDEGLADIVIGRRYPELRSTFLAARLMKYHTLLHSVLQMLVFNLPLLGDWLAARGLQGLQLLEFLRLRGLWRFALDGLLAYWYWRGIAEGIGSRRRFYEWMSDFIAPKRKGEAILDLRSGIAAATAHLDAERPHSAQIWYGDCFVGQIAAEPGAECLTGAHLRPWLMDHGATSLFNAVAEQNGLSTAEDAMINLPSQIADLPMPTLREMIPF